MSLTYDLALCFGLGQKSVLVTEGFRQRAFYSSVAVLVNEHTTCASEMVALFAQEEARRRCGNGYSWTLVTHIGFKVGHGFTLALPVAAYVSWAGTRLAGTGIASDVILDRSYSDARN